MRFNKRRHRYERLGLLVEEAALARAERACLADSEARARRRERDRRRRAAEDIRFTAAFAAEIVRLFPGCPAERAVAIATHASVRGSGRVGRTAAGRALDELAVSVAVRAAVRHTDTEYDALLMAGVPGSRPAPGWPRGSTPSWTGGVRRLRGRRPRPLRTCRPEPAQLRRKRR